MARNIPLQALRTTRAALDTQAAASGLLAGEPYLITDEGRIAMGTATNAYAECIMDADIGTKVSSAPIEDVAGINPTLDLDFSKQSYRVYDGANGLKTLTPVALLTDLLTFTRASPATYFDAKGVMQSATDNVPRIDYDPVTGECKGLLVEEARTSLLTYSSDFSNVNWLLSGTTVSPFVDGARAAYKLTETNITGSHNINQLHTAAASTTFTLSVFCKAETRNKFRLSGRGGNWAVYPEAYYDLDLGTLISSKTSASIQNLGDGWFRCSLTGTTTTGVNSGLVINIVDDAGNVTYTGDGTSGIYIFGAQMEVGTFPTSLIHTTTTAVTRAADVASIAGANFSKWYSAEGTLLAKYANAGWMSMLSPSLTALDLADFIDDASQVNDRLERLIFFPRELPAATIEAITR